MQNRLSKCLSNWQCWLTIIICTNLTNFVFICLVPFKNSKCIHCVLLFAVWKIFSVQFLNCLAAVRSFFLAVKAKPHHLRVLFYFLTAFLIAVNWNLRAADVTGQRKAPLTDLTFNLENGNLINTLKVILYSSWTLRLYIVVMIKTGGLRRLKRQMFVEQSRIPPLTLNTV